MEKQLENEVRFLKRYAVIVTMLLVIFLFSAFALRSDYSAVEEITARRINMVDSDGKVRVILAGEFPKSRADMAGLIFNNPDGSEAGGLGYRGKRDKDGRVEAGSILTFDQYGSDQVVSLGYSQTGDQKVLGLTVNDRPESMSELVKEAYRAIEGAKTPGEADSLRRSYMSVFRPET